MGLIFSKETIPSALKFSGSAPTNSRENRAEMQATLYPVYGPVWVPRRHVIYVYTQLPSGEKIKEKKEVLDANAEYDFSEDYEDFDNVAADPPEEPSESSSTDSEASSGEEESVEDSKAPLASQSALVPAEAPAAPTMMSAAAIAEQRRLKEIHAQVRADPRSALEIIQPENIGCDDCDDGTGQMGGEEERPHHEQVCHKCRREKKTHCKHVHVDIVVCKKPEPPCNTTTNTEPLVKAKCHKKHCDRGDIEVTKTYQAWAASMEQFAPVKAQDPSLQQKGQFKEDAATYAAVAAATERANALINDFTAKGGLAKMINSSAENATREKLSASINAGLRDSSSAEQFLGVFEHAYVSMPVTVAAIGKILPDEHVQKVIIGVVGAPVKNKKTGETEFRIGLAVKPDGAEKGSEQTARDVFIVKRNGSSLKAELRSAGMRELQDKISVTAARESIGKIGSLLKKITGQ